MSVREELLKRQLLEEVGGSAYLGSILNTVADASQGAHYAGGSCAKSTCCGN
jgi:replicative DNA helicase